MILHDAGQEGALAGANAARFPHVVSKDRQVALGIVFSDPQIAAVGVRANELEPSCIKATVDFVAQPRTKVMGRARGRGELYADATGKLIGAELLGPDVEHLGHLLAWVIQRGLSARDVLELPFYHPVIEEALKAPLRQIAKRAS
jgi:dihydrolipoamide dehydrogenase